MYSHRTQDFVSLNGTISKFMAWKLTNHCMVNVKNKVAVFIGGIHAPFNLTSCDSNQMNTRLYTYFAFDQETKMSAIHEEIRLAKARESNACGVIYDSSPMLTNLTFYVVTWGGRDGNKDLVDSTEVMAIPPDFEYNDGSFSNFEPNWKEGPKVPYGIAGMSGAATPDGKTLISAGGEGLFGFLPKDIFMLRVTDRKWKWSMFEAKLDHGRAYPVALILPNTQATCV